MAARTGRWRPVGVIVLLLVVALLTPLAVVATWLRYDIGDTDRYVDAVAPLAADPDVQAAVAHRVSEGILSVLDVEAISRQGVEALGSRSGGPRRQAAREALVGSLSEAISGLVEREAAQLVTTPQFAAAWTEANREAHGQLVAVLTGEGQSTVSVEGNAVRLDLSVVLDSVKRLLTDRGIRAADLIPATTATFTIFESAHVGQAQVAARWLDRLAWVLPAVALAGLLLAVAIASRRRRTLLAGGIVVAASMILLGVALHWARGVYLDELPSGVSSPAAAAVFDALTDALRRSLRWVLAASVVLAALAWLAGARGRRTPDAVTTAPAATS